MVTDPISDMIVRLKNAQLAGLPSVLIPYSQFKQNIAEVLKTSGYLKSVNKKGKKVKKFLEVELIYTGSKSKITEIKRVSKPSRRVYHDHREIKSVRQGFGLAIYSTPRGILTDKQAREAKVGGEILFTLY